VDAVIVEEDDCAKKGQRHHREIFCFLFNAESPMGYGILRRLAIKNDSIAIL